MTVYIKRYRLQRNVRGEWVDTQDDDSAVMLELIRRTLCRPELYRVIDTKEAAE